MYLKGEDNNGNIIELNKMWSKRIKAREIIPIVLDPNPEGWKMFGRDLLDLNPGGWKMFSRDIVVAILIKEGRFWFINVFMLGNKFLDFYVLISLSTT